MRFGGRDDNGIIPSASAKATKRKRSDKSDGSALGLFKKKIDFKTK